MDEFLSNLIVSDPIPKPYRLPHIQTERQESFLLAVAGNARCVNGNKLLQIKLDKVNQAVSITLIVR
jgi:hypothetical protein